MKKLISCFFTILLTSLCFAQDIKIEDLTLKDYLFDLTTLDSLISKQHPNPYKFVTKEEQQKFKNEAIKNLKKNPSYLNFIKSLNRFGDGHLGYYSQSGYADYVMNKYTYFPFPLVIRDGRMFVNIKGGKLKYGTEILSIQNKSVKDLLIIFNKYIYGDGYLMTGTEARISNLFPVMYTNFVESNVNKFNIEYVSYKSNKTQHLMVNSVDYYKSYRRQLLAVQPINRLEQKGPIVSRYYRSKNTGVITINTFGLDESSEYRELSQFFKKINKEKYKSVIIDLRTNGGGDPNMAALLFSFITDSNFKNSFNYKMKNIKIVRKNLVDDNGNPSSNDKIENFENFLYQRFNKDEKGNYIGNERLKEGVLENFPSDKDSFNGDVYLMVGGKTFSASVFFAKLFKDHKRGKIIGVETGGNENNTFAGYFLKYKLPRTKLTVRIPITELYFGDDKKSNHGIIPEITIPIKKYQEYMRKEQDPELQYLMDYYIK
ncbi:MAG: S41 family peptidase [Polaribacter sp.]